MRVTSTTITERTPEIEEGRQGVEALVARDHCPPGTVQAHDARRALDAPSTSQ